MSLLVIGIRQSLIFFDKRALGNIKTKLIISALILTIILISLLLTKLHSYANLSEVKPYLGKKVSVEYFVFSPYQSKRGHVFLKGKDFTAVIFEEAVPRFSPNLVKLYGNKKIRVNGLLQNYKDRSEIIVSNPNQIEIIK